MKPTIDSILFGLIQKNNTKAFLELYKRHWLSIYRPIYLRTADQVITREIVAEIFVAIWEKRSFIHIDNNCDRYLKQVTRHKVMDWALEENILSEAGAERIADNAPDTSMVPHKQSDLPDIRKRLIAWFDSFTDSEDALPVDETEISSIETEMQARIFDHLGLNLPVVGPSSQKPFVVPELAVRIVKAIMVLILLGGIWELFIG